MPGQVDAVRTVNSLKGVAKRAANSLKGVAKRARRFSAVTGSPGASKVRIKCAAML
ncbi:hypothetical protein LTSEMIN_1563 [Salmonella enterica subsp. enterica serovar Minnesota str. A4-603]|nr:hypothetical protein LTSEMIN_1563 [Salmonella enterica subsp. enterica serovar Minnesota str. A4-603]